MIIVSEDKGESRRQKFPSTQGKRIDVVKVSGKGNRRTLEILDNTGLRGRPECKRLEEGWCQQMTTILAILLGQVSVGLIISVSEVKRTPLSEYG